jgi:hypothetical protein
MNSVELACLGECLIEIRFLGVYPRDMIPPPTVYPSCLIANTDTSNEPGMHWVAIVYASPNRTEFYDSFALPPYLHNIDLLPTYTNPKRVQSLYSVQCGEHCLYYLYLRSLGYSIYDVVNRFSNDYNCNDKFVKSFVMTHRSRCPIHYTCQCPHLQSSRSCHSLLK